MTSRRVLLVPSVPQGSGEHFYDFLLGYLYPVTLWVARHPRTPVTVRPCGGMNPWFSLLPPGTDLQMVPPGGMLRRFVAHREPRAVLRSRMLGATPTPPRDQIAAHTGARVIVGQHGAGLVNMLWMPPGSTVVEALRRRPAPVPQTAGVRIRREAFRAGKLTEERLRRAPVVGLALRRLR